MSVNLHDQRYVNTTGSDTTPYERMMDNVKEQVLRGKITALTNTGTYKRSGSGTAVFAGSRRYQDIQKIVERV